MKTSSQPFLAITCAIALWVATTAVAIAAKTEIVPRIDVGALHETNPRLSRITEEDATGLIIDGRLLMGWSTERTDWSFDPRLRLSRYDEDDDRDLENDDFWLPFSLEHETSRSLTNFLVEYSEVGVRTSEVESAAGGGGGGGSTNLTFVEDTREQIRIEPSWAYQVTQKDTFRISAGFSGNEYDQVDTGRFDYDYFFADTSWQHRFTAKTSIGILLNAARFDSENPAAKADPVGRQGQATNNDTTTYGVSLFTDYLLSQTLTASLYLGLRDTEAEITTNPFLDFFGTEFCITPEGQLAPPPCKEEFEDDSWVGQASLTKEGQRTDYTLSFSRSIIPSSRGAETLRNEFRGTINHDFSRKVNGRLGLLFFNEDFAAQTSGFDRNFVSINLNLEWLFAKTWGLRGAYRYVFVEEDFDTGVNQDATNNYFFVGLFYRGLGWRL